MPSHSAAHTALVAAILHEFGSRPDVRLWRANVLVARTQTGQVVRAGIKGQADISGILSPSGKRIEVEVKTGAGVPSEAQRNWCDMIAKFGGIAIVARSLDDVRAGLPQPQTAPPR